MAPKPNEPPVTSSVTTWPTNHIAPSTEIWTNSIASQTASPADTWIRNRIASSTTTAQVAMPTVTSNLPLSPYRIEPPIYLIPNPNDLRPVVPPNAHCVIVSPTSPANSAFPTVTSSPNQTVPTVTWATNRIAPLIVTFTNSPTALSTRSRSTGSDTDLETENGEVSDDDTDTTTQ